MELGYFRPKFGHFRPFSDHFELQNFNGKFVPDFLNFSQFSPPDRGVEPVTGSKIMKTVKL